MSCTLSALSQDFKPVTIEDIHTIERYLQLCQYEESNHNLVNMILWMDAYPLFMVQEENYLLLLGIHKGELFIYMPLCKPQYFNEAIYKAKSIFDYYQVPFVLSCFTKEAMEKVLALFPQACACEARESFDYVYATEKFRTLAGKKLQKKRNHYNAFVQMYQGRYQYETMDESNVVECRFFFEQWKQEDQDDFLNEERKGVRRILDLFGKLDYRGGCIRLDGKIVAFAIASHLSDRMCQENIEKADGSIRGLYQVLQKEFFSHEFTDTPYVNREDDMGHENIRKSKLSYYPEWLIEKYRLCSEGKKTL